MRRTRKALVSGCLLAVLALAFIIPAGASTGAGPDAEIQASQYYSHKTVNASSDGNGRVSFLFKAFGTGTMSEIGASRIVVYEESSSGIFEKVYTYTRDTTPGLIQKNAGQKIGTVTYQGKVGKKYYAIVTFYAANANGSEFAVMKTPTVTAT